MVATADLLDRIGVFIETLKAVGENDPESWENCAEISAFLCNANISFLESVLNYRLNNDPEMALSKIEYFKYAMETMLRQANTSLKELEGLIDKEAEDHAEDAQNIMKGLFRKDDDS